MVEFDEVEDAAGWGIPTDCVEHGGDDRGLWGDSEGGFSLCGDPGYIFHIDRNQGVALSIWVGRSEDRRLHRYLHQKRCTCVASLRCGTSSPDGRLNGLAFSRAALIERDDIV